MNQNTIKTNPNVVSHPNRSKEPVKSVQNTGNFQTLVAGWESNTSVGKGVTATTVASFPANGQSGPDQKVPKSSSFGGGQVNNETSVPPSESKQRNVTKSEIFRESYSVTSQPDTSTLRPNSIFNPAMYSSASNLYSLTVTNPTSSSGRNAALRDQFLVEPPPTSGSSTSLVNTPVSPSRQQLPMFKALTPTTPTFGGGYRYAGVERLAQRSKIYESPTSTTFRNKSGEQSVKINVKDNKHDHESVSS